MPMDDITQAVLARDEVVRVPARRPRRSTAPRRASASTPTSTSCGRRSATRSTARSSTRSTRSCARSSASPSTSSIAQAATRGRARHLRLEPQEPHRLPGRAAGARRQRHPAADHRRRHQPVRRPARPAPPARHRRDPDPPQHQGPGVPHHAEGVRRRAAAAPRPVLLPGGRPQLQRRAEAAEDRPAPRGAAGGDSRTWSSCRRRSPTTSCSRITSWRGRGSSGGSGRSAASSPRWCATRSATESRAFVTFGDADSARRLRPASRAATCSTSRTARADASAGSTRCCRRRSSPPRMRPVDHAARARGARRRAHRARCAPRGANLGVDDGAQAVDAGRRAARGARHHRRRTAAASACATQRAALLRAHDRAPARRRRRPTDALMLDALSKAFFHALAGSRDAQAPRVALRHAPARQLRAPLHRRRDRRRGHRGGARPRRRTGLPLTLDHLGESVATLDEADAATRDYLAIIDAIVAVGHRAATSR